LFNFFNDRSITDFFDDDSEEIFRLFAENSPHSWLTDKLILEGEHPLSYEVTLDPSTPLESHFTLVSVLRPVGTEDLYWYRIEIHETYYVFGPRKVRVRAAVILPLGPRRITRTEMTDFLMQAFENYISSPLNHGLPYVISDEAGIQALGGLELIPEGPKLWYVRLNGYVLNMRQVSEGDGFDEENDQLRVVVRKIPRYGSPANAQLILIASWSGPAQRSTTYHTIEGLGRKLETQTS
jgi:hypothetical protein